MTETHSKQKPEFIQTNDPLALAALLLAALNRPGHTIIEIGDEYPAGDRAAEPQTLAPGPCTTPRIFTPGGRA